MANLKRSPAIKYLEKVQESSCIQSGFDFKRFQVATKKDHSDNEKKEKNINVKQTRSKTKTKKTWWNHHSKTATAQKKNKIK